MFLLGIIIYFIDGIYVCVHMCKSVFTHRYTDVGLNKGYQKVGRYVEVDCYELLGGHGLKMLSHLLKSVSWESFCSLDQIGNS